MKRALAALRSTRGRLVLLAIAALAAAALIADIGLYSWLTFSQRGDTDGLLQRHSAAVATGLQATAGIVTYHGRPLPGEASNGVAVDSAVVGPGGVLAQSQEQPLAPATLVEVAAPVLRTGRSIWVDLVDSHHVQRRVFVSAVTVGPTRPAALVVSRSVGELQVARLRTLVMLGLLSGVAVVLGGVIAYWLAGRVLRPVHEIAALASTLSQRELHRRVDVDVPDDELGELVRTLNGMLGRLEASFEALRAFTADASHELRTPLTLMQTELEFALGRSRTAAEYRRTLEVLDGEVHHLTGIVEGLLVLARADAGQLHAERSRLDVVDLVHETVARWSGTAARRTVALEGAAPLTGAVEADPQLMRRILDNLIDNAIRHSPRGGAVHLEVRRTPEGWIFSVSDQGEGVPPRLRSTIFSRFMRGDPARTRVESGGVGLGLALSRAVARVQGGELRLADSRQGATFEIVLPDRDGPGTAGQEGTAGVGIGARVPR